MNYTTTNPTANQQRALRLFELADELTEQIQRAHKCDQIDAFKATWLIHFVIDVDSMRATAVKLWNGG